MKALLINATLKRSPERSNTAALAQVVMDELETQGVECEMLRAVDHVILPGITNDEGEGDAWPAIHEKLVEADILVMATPTWMGQPSSVAQRVLERMDAMLEETDDEGRPVAYGKVAGMVVTGNEDGAHHIIGILAGVLGDVGYTVPGQAWTYWNRGPGPGPDYLDTDEGHDWAASTGRTAARNLVAVARALAATPIPAA